MNPQDHIEVLLELAAKSPCSRDKRGAIVVRDGEVIGRGFNAPVGGACTDAVCHKVEVRTIPSTFSGYGASRSETIESVRSCGGHVEHAEAMAMRTALPHAIAFDLNADRDTFADMLDEGSYHHPLNGCELIHMDTQRCIRRCVRGMADDTTSACCHCHDSGRQPQRSRRRGCPSCAVLASGFGIDAIWLLHEDGWQRWPMAEYAKLAGVV